MTAEQTDDAQRAEDQDLGRDDSVATAVADAPPATDDTPAGTDGDGTGADANAQTTEPVATADPGFEAAIGSSGARALGDATSVADRVADAVEGDGTAAAPDEADAAPRAEPAPTDAATGDGAEAPSPATGSTEPVGGGDEAAPDPAVVSEAPPAAELAEAPPAESDDVPAAEPVVQRVEDRPEPTTMEELLSQQEGDIKTLKHGDVVEGNVVRIDKDEILVDIGAKSEGVVSNRELYGRNAESQPQLNIGDTVLVYVLQPESQEGHAVLSLRRAGLERKWRSMQELFDAGTIIEAPVIDHNKGGLIVDCGIRGFVPISQIVDFPRRPQNEQPRDAAQEIAEKLQPYVGRKLRLKILEVNRKANRLILSEKVALYEERREKRDELFSSLQVNQKVTGTVRSIAPFGVFVDLGGIDGLVHKSELSWNKVNNPESGYKVGDEVEAEVIDINHERGRISLSIRRLQPDPWHSTVADFKVADVIDGTVTKIVNFGAFVRVREGLEGLIHISELSHQRVAHPGDVVHEGQRLKLKIISLDSERHRLGLSLKQAEEPPARPADAGGDGRPVPTGGGGGGGTRERGRRQERGYDPSQAVQEPEGGIDNTLAAAFAQVRQQMAESERAGGDESDATDAYDTSEPVATTVEPVEALIDEVPPVPQVAAETDDAPALEVPPAPAAGNDGGEPADASMIADSAPPADADMAPSDGTTTDTAGDVPAPTTTDEAVDGPTAGTFAPEDASTADESSSDVAPQATATDEATAPDEATTTDEATAPDEATATDEGTASDAGVSTTEAASDEAGLGGADRDDVPARGGEDDEGATTP